MVLHGQSWDFCLEAHRKEWEFVPNNKTYRIGNERYGFGRMSSVMRYLLPSLIVKIFLWQNSKDAYVGEV